jgi:hypothetical protein
MLTSSYLPCSCYYHHIITYLHFYYYRVGDGNPKNLPHPDEEWDVFLSKLKQLNNEEPKIWDTLTKQPQSWINIKKIQEVYGGAHGHSSGVCAIM